MEQIRMGLIGCGMMMEGHARAINLVTEKLQIVAVCDVIKENAQAVADALDNDVYVATRWEELVDKVDAVLVALPHDLHYECGVFFARHKKHLLMEKPLANSEEECIRLINICEEEGVKLMCGYPMRYVPGLVKLRELVTSGEYGKIMMMSIWTEQLTKLPENHWSCTSRLGGGQLFSHGCHYIDLMLWFLGDPVQGTHIGTTVGTPWLMKEGTSAVTMKFENGAVGYHGGTWGARGTRLGYDFQVQTEKGMLEYKHATGELLLYDKNKEHVPGEEEEKVERKILHKFEPGKQTQYEIRHFVDCILEDKVPLTDGHSALQSLRVIWKLYEAENSGVVADLRGLGLPETSK